MRKTDVKCDICGNKMKETTEKSLFLWEGQEYHADAKVLSCSCGYRKLATCDVHFCINDGNGSGEADAGGDNNSSESENGNSADSNTASAGDKAADAADASAVNTETIEKPENNEIGMPFPFGGAGKWFWSDAWLDYMSEKEWFVNHVYDKIVSHAHRQERYLAVYIPLYRTIQNDVLYDTEKARLFFTEESKEVKKKHFGAWKAGTTIITKKYYYMTENCQYFSITVRMGEDDSLDVKSVNDIKRLLKNDPETYADVIKEKVENMESQKKKAEGKKDGNAGNTAEVEALDGIFPKKNDDNSSSGSNSGGTEVPPKQQQQASYPANPNGRKSFT